MSTSAGSWYYEYMLNLYIRTACPYSAKVLEEEAKAMKLDITTKNVAYADVAADLKARAGKLQTPYLVDEENNIEMFESNDIIEYLHHRLSGTGA
ncbi:glutathione S-transferase N-terminal domain-containing protein [Patescibacteria group bacterium]|nr:glutathione S-transferase N-terminal domain-containing protein [Patescibacteria group bacterium]